ncbi:MAG: hypothetical protein J6038_02700 [Bacilli bacterium]|nr:hypothetical protein [Bacilli bacterium]
MKDKLQKTNRKKAYYRIRAFGIAFLLALGVLALSSIPVIVSYTATISVSAAEEKPQAEISVIDSAGLSLPEYE